MLHFNCERQNKNKKKSGKIQLYVCVNNLYNGAENGFLAPKNKQEFCSSKTCDFFFTKFFYPPLIACFNVTCLKWLSVKDTCPHP